MKSSRLTTTMLAASCATFWLSSTPAGAQQNFPSGISIGTNPDTSFYSWHSGAKTGSSINTPWGGLILYSGMAETSRARFDGGVTLYGKPISMVLGADNETTGDSVGTFDIWRNDDYWSTAQGLKPVFRIDTAASTADFDSVNVTISNGTLSVGGSPAITTASASSVLGGQGFLQLSGGVLNVPSTTISTSSSTGALTVGGGIGVLGDSYISEVRIGRGSAGVVSNTVVGNEGLNSNTTGLNNTALGFGALRSNTTGSNNVALGTENLANNTGGSNNVALGKGAGSHLGDGTSSLVDPENSIYIGAGALAHSNSDENSIVIGAAAVGEGANTTVIGNSNTTQTRLYGKTVTETLEVNGGGSVNSLNVVGDATAGTLSVGGATTLNGAVILAAPQGDISMGIYGN